MTPESDPKGPNIEIPEELAEALGAEGDAESEAGAPEIIEVEPVEEAAPASGGAGSEEAAALQDRLLRMAADHENQKRRWLREQQDMLNFANENLIKELLPIVDNLERALEHARQSQADEKEKKNLLEGIELTYRSFMGVLERVGVEVVETDGAEFDPRHHEAMRQVASAEHAPGAIIDVYQRGYKLKGRLLRPALVAIAGPDSGGASAG